MRLLPTEPLFREASSVERVSGGSLHAVNAFLAVQTCAVDLLLLLMLPLHC